MINSNIGPNWAPLRNIRLGNVSDFDIDLDFDLSRSLKVKFETVIGLPIYVYGFLSMFNGNIGPNWAPLRGIRL